MMIDDRLEPDAGETEVMTQIADTVPEVDQTPAGGQSPIEGIKPRPFVGWLSRSRNQRVLYVFTLVIIMINLGFVLLWQHTDLRALLVAGQAAVRSLAPGSSVLTTPTSTSVPTVVSTATATTAPAPTATPVSAAPTTMPTPTSEPVIPTVAPTPTPVPVVPTVAPTPTPAPISLLANGSFENGLTAWGFKVNSPASATASTTTATKVDGADAVQIKVISSSSIPWDVQLLQDSLPVTKGTTYTISFMAKASRTMPLQQIIQLSQSPWTTYVDQELSLTTSWQQYTYIFTAPVSANVLFTFNVAQTQGTIWFDNVIFSS